MTAHHTAAGVDIEIGILRDSLFRRGSAALSSAPGCAQRPQRLVLPSRSFVSGCFAYYCDQISCTGSFSLKLLHQLLASFRAAWSCAFAIFQFRRWLPIRSPGPDPGVPADGGNAGFKTEPAYDRFQGFVLTPLAEILNQAAEFIDVESQEPNAFSKDVQDLLQACSGVIRPLWEL